MLAWTIAVFETSISTLLKKEWKLELNPPVGEPMTSIFPGLSLEDERPQYPITHGVRSEDQLQSWVDERLAGVRMP